jgi:hypothetical protein
MSSNHQKAKQSRRFNQETVEQCTLSKFHNICKCQCSHKWTWTWCNIHKTLCNSSNILKCQCRCINSSITLCKCTIHSKWCNSNNLLLLHHQHLKKIPSFKTVRTSIWEFHKLFWILKINKACTHNNFSSNSIKCLNTLAIGWLHKPSQYILHNSTGMKILTRFHTH